MKPSKAQQKISLPNYAKTLLNTANQDAASKQEYSEKRKSFQETDEDWISSVKKHAENRNSPKQ